MIRAAAWHWLPEQHATAVGSTSDSVCE
jgi:hypothetical protein